MTTKLLRNDPNFAGSINDVRYVTYTDESYVIQSMSALKSGIELNNMLSEPKRNEMDELFANRLHQLFAYGYNHCVQDSLY